MDTFSVKMSDIIEWVDFKLEGCEGRLAKVGTNGEQRMISKKILSKLSLPVGRLPQVELTCCTINNNVLWLVSASRFFESGTLTFKFKREKSAACLN